MVPVRVTFRVKVPAVSATVTAFVEKAITLSSSRTVTVTALFVVSTASPVGELRVRVKSSADSTATSLVITIEIVLFVSLAAKVKMPEAAR